MKKMLILVIDDIYTNRLLLGEIIDELGYEYMEANNGRQALELMENNDFQLILMDIEMPVMNGLETIDAIRKNKDIKINSLPVIALTAHNPITFFEDFNAVGFNDLLTKPYSIKKVAAIINAIMEEKA